MKILMTTNTYLPVVGGLEKSIQSFTNQLREWGHEVVIAVPKLGETEGEEDGIFKVPAIHMDQPSDFSIPLPLISPLTKLVDSFQPDVIHAHHPFWMGETALKLSAHFAKPLVFTYHIMFDQYAHYLPLPIHLARRFLVEFAVGYCNLSARVIAPSGSVREVLLRDGVTTPIDVVPSGVDLNTFESRDRLKIRKRLKISDDACVLGYVGRLMPEKNLEFLARATSEVMNRYESVHFLVVGEGASKEMIQHIFSKSKLSHRLYLIGNVQGSAVADYYHAMDVFAFASKSETQGMVLCEAMAAGVPVVAIDSSGVREVVRDRINGCLIKKENRREFQSGLIWCLKQKRNVDQWKKLQANAKSTAKNFSLESCTLRLLKVYESALQDYSIPLIEKQDSWHRMVRQFKTEWKLVENFGRATTLALKEMVSN